MIGIRVEGYGGGGEVEGGVKVVLVRVKVVQGAQNCIFPTRAS